MIYTLSNDSLTIKINSFGAELQSIFDNHSNQELLWQANKQHWARHAPILFPIVGKLQNDELKTAGNSYPISQHGFARDSEFSLLSQDDTSIELQLKNSEKTKIHFPFEFELNIKYKLENTGLRCTF
ncbi:MAG: aldose 1-epimerase family protein, partial [Gammaproteobacteria bacterium]|nr:aldose 1-epimerase family protein [Gammaproteobacteria bacterium]